MATQAQINNIVKAINSTIDIVLAIKIEDIVREKELGTTLSFKVEESTFIKIFELLKKIKDVNLSNASFTSLNEFKTHLDVLNSILDQINKFSATTNNAINIRNSYINSIGNSYDSLFNNSMPLLFVGLINSNDLSVERSKMNLLINELENQNKVRIDEGGKKLKELDDILANAKTAATKVGISVHTKVFKEESDFHEVEASNWLKYTVRVLIAIALVAVIMTIIGILWIDDTKIIQFAISKVIILSVLFYGLGITNRNYKAHKHNAVLNKHRQNALSTFETFSGAESADNQTKNAVLLEATHSIFSTHQTGYLKNEGDGDSPNKIIEIIKNVTANK